LIDQAKTLEAREIETKLVKLKELLTEQGVFKDPKMKLLLFTEHKDTLDYLVGKLRTWGSPSPDPWRDEDRRPGYPRSRIYAERQFKEECQVLVATEAAGEASTSSSAGS